MTATVVPLDAELAPSSSKLGNRGDDCEFLWSTEELFPLPVWSKDQVVGTPNVEVVVSLPV